MTAHLVPIHELDFEAILAIYPNGISGFPCSAELLSACGIMGEVNALDVDVLVQLIKVRDILLEMTGNAMAKRTYGWEWKTVEAAIRHSTISHAPFL